MREFEYADLDSESDDGVFPPTSDNERVKAIRNPNAQRAHHIKIQFGEKLTLAPDMIFVEEKDINVNQGRLVATRELDIEPMKEAQLTIERRIRGHHEVCDEMEKAFNSYGDAKFSEYKLVNGKGVARHHHEAAGICESMNRELVEVKSETEKAQLLELLDSIPSPHVEGMSLRRIHAGVQRVGSRPLLEFTSGTKYSSHHYMTEDVRRVTPFCTDLVEEIKRGFRNNSQPTFYYHYFPTENIKLELCIENPRGKYVKYRLKEVICMKREPRDDVLRLDKDADFCRTRNQDLQSTSDEVRGSISIMSDMLSPRKLREASSKRSTVDHGDAPHTELQGFSAGRILDRVARFIMVLPLVQAIGYGALALVSLLVNLAVSTYNTVSHTTNTKSMRKMEFNMDQISEDFNTTVMKINAQTQMRSKKEHLRRREQEYYDRVTLDFSNLRDNLLSHEAVLNSVVNKEANLQLINDTDVEILEREIRGRRNIFLSRKHHSYDTYPIIEDDKLKIAISIPVLTPSKEAKLYSIVKIPTYINGSKYMSDCAETHLIVYKESSDWNTVSIDEALKCMDPKSRCQINQARRSSRIQNCASSQFFLKAHSVKLRSVDNEIPFAHSINDTIVLSLPPHRTTLEFHCEQMNRPGADRIIKVSGRALVHNPLKCDFSLPEYGLSYSPYRDPVRKNLPPTRGRFTISHRKMSLPKDANEPNYIIDAPRSLNQGKDQEDQNTNTWTPFRIGLIVVMTLLITLVILLIIALCLIYHHIPLPGMTVSETPEAQHDIPMHIVNPSDDSSEGEEGDPREGGSKDAQGDFDFMLGTPEGFKEGRTMKTAKRRLPGAKRKADEQMK